METLASNKMVQRLRGVGNTARPPSTSPVVSHARLPYHLKYETSSTSLRLDGSGG